MRALFVCDAGPEVGGGHVMRCLTLAGALQARGLEPVFMETPPVADLLDRFAPDMARAHAREGWLAEATAAAAGDLVIIDHYRVFAQDQETAAAGRPLLVLDDMADRPLRANLVVNSGLAHSPEAYRGLVSPDAGLLLGPAHAPVRPEFAAARPAALARRGGPVERIVVSLGLGDQAVGALLRLLRPLVGDRAVDLVLPSGATAPQLDWPGLTVLRDVRDMAGLYAAADLAIGAGGMSAWERCVVGLPSLNLILAPNQQPNARALEAAGGAWSAVLWKDSETLFHRRLMTLLDDPDQRTRMSQAAAALCDGLGADRVADAVLALLPSR